jgi:hypothetical protein
MGKIIWQQCDFAVIWQPWLRQFKVMMAQMPKEREINIRLAQRKDKTGNWQLFTTTQLGDQSSVAI